MPKEQLKFDLFTWISKHSKITLCGISSGLAKVTDDFWKHPKFYVDFFFKGWWELQVPQHTPLGGKS